MAEMKKWDPRVRILLNFSVFYFSRCVIRKVIIYCVTQSDMYTYSVWYFIGWKYNTIKESSLDKVTIS